MRVLDRPVARPRGHELSAALTPDVEVAGSVRPAEPLLARRGVEVAAQQVHVQGHRADPLGAVEQHRHAGRAEGAAVHDLAGLPRHVRAGDQLRALADRARQLRERRDPHLDARARLQGGERGEHAGVLLVAGQHLVARLERQRGEHGVDSVRRGAGERDLAGLAAEHGGGMPAQLLHALEHALDQRPPGAALVDLPLERGPSGFSRPGRDGPVRARVQVGHALEHRELTSKLVHATGY